MFIPLDQSTFPIGTDDPTVECIQWDIHNIVIEDSITGQILSPDGTENFGNTGSTLSFVSQQMDCLPKVKLY